MKLKPQFTPEDGSADERIIAASLMLALLRKSGVATPAELTASLSDPAIQKKLRGVELSDEQLDILERNQVAASYVRIKPSVSIVTCAVCGEWLVSDSAVTRCQMTAGCTGRKKDIVKAKFAVIDKET